MTDSFVLTEKDVVMDFDEDCNVDLAELDNVTEMLTRLTSKDQSKVSFSMNNISELVNTSTSYVIFYRYFTECNVRGGQISCRKGSEKEAERLSGKVFTNDF